MTKAEATELFLHALGEIAPEVDPDAIDSARPLRDQLDLDSMDFLNLVAALSEATGADIPERDYDTLATLEGAADYITRAAA